MPFRRGNINITPRIDVDFFFFVSFKHHNSLSSVNSFFIFFITQKWPSYVPVFTLRNPSAAFPIPFNITQNLEYRILYCSYNSCSYIFTRKLNPITCNCFFVPFKSKICLTTLKFPPLLIIPRNNKHIVQLFGARFSVRFTWLLRHSGAVSNALIDLSCQILN